METWRSIAAALRKGGFLAFIDLEEAYFHVPIFPAHRRFLRFSYGSLHYQYRAIPFGLRSALQVFTKILVAVVAHLRLRRVFLYPYLDDILIRSSSRMQALQDVNLTVSCLKSLGFVINLAKSSLDPVQGIEHLGLWLDTANFRVSLSRERQVKILAFLHMAMRTHHLQLMFLARLLGMMVSCHDIVAWAQFHPRSLQTFLRPFQRCIERRSRLLLHFPREQRLAVLCGLRRADYQRAPLWATRRDLWLRQMPA